MAKAPTLEDFEAFDEGREGEAIAAAASSFRVLHLIDREHPLVLWVYSTATGSAYWLPLDIPTSSYLELMGEDGAEPVDALRKVLKTFSPEDAEKLEGESTIAISNILKVYGEVFAKVQGATLGE